MGPALASLTLGLAVLASAASAQQVVVTYADHLRRLVEPRAHAPGSPTIQFSSYDRRSTSAQAPHWFANSDGFGREPIPGFLRTLREPAADLPGEYLVAEVEGPGTIVRTWSAGMGGVLRVVLDGADAPLFEGPAAPFLRAKSRIFLERAGVPLDPSGSFVQQDADYLPLPFEKGLRITWTGRLDELHFYHVVVARGALHGGSTQAAFAPRQLQDHRAELERVHAVLLGTQAHVLQGGENAGVHEFATRLEPGRSWRWQVPAEARVGLLGLALQCTATDRAAALRGTALRVRFDGAATPQVEAPLGDFFLSAPGVQPHRSLWFTVTADGWMTCRLPMPFDHGCELELENTTSAAVTVRGHVHTASQALGLPLAGGPGTPHLHAKWRADHDLVATREGTDVGYLNVTGAGTLVGVACFLMNPSAIPTPGGSWWGEGDEKVVVDGEPFPSWFGTGSEDFFNYAWSRPGLFAHAYCGQPTCTGPGTSGYVTNYRLLVPDCIPFTKSLSFAMELLHHQRVPGFAYARIAYWYAAPGGTDDHRPLAAGDLVVPRLPAREVLADGGAKGATVKRAADLEPRCATPLLEISEPLAPSQRLLGFAAKGGERIELALPIAEAGRWTLHVVALQRSDAATWRCIIDGEVRPRRGAAGATDVSMTSPSACVQDVEFEAVDLAAGTHALVIEARSAGLLGLDTLWWKRTGPAGR